MALAVSNSPSTVVLPPLRSFVARNARPVLLSASAAVTIVAAGLLALFERESSAPNWLAFEQSTLIAVIVAVLSCVPVAVCVNRPLMVAVAAYFVSAALRVVGILAGVGVVIYLRRGPAMPVVAMVMIYYASLLVVESAVLGMALWNRSR